MGAKGVVIMESNTEVISTKNEKLGLIIDLSRNLEAVNKRLKACEEELEKWNKEKLRLEREAEKLIEKINRLSLELHER